MAERKAGENGGIKPEIEVTLTKLRVQYWTKRLDHTLTHTQTSSRLIYLVDAAVLALVYFVIQAFDATRTIIGFASFPMLVLTGLNVMHALLIRSQRRWYNGIDNKLMGVLTVDPVFPDDPKHPKHRWWNSTFGIYQAMHWWIAVALFVMAGSMIAYSLGQFSELPIHKSDSAKTSKEASVTIQPPIPTSPILNSRNIVQLLP